MTEKPPTDSKGSTPDAYDNILLKSEQVGVYRLVIATAKDRRQQFVDSLRQLREAAPPILRLLQDVYALSPTLFIYVVLAQVWSGLEDAFLVYLSTRLLRTIEFGLTSGKPFAMEVIWALGLRIACVALSEYISWSTQKLDDRLKSLVSSHYDLYLMNVKLRLDIPTSLDAASSIDATGTTAANAFENVLQYFTSILTTFSQIMIIYRESRASGDPIFLLACLSKPVFSTISVKDVWNKEGFAHINNEDYKRMQSLKKLSGGTYREDVLSNGLAGWILKEYGAACERLGGISFQSPFVLLSRHSQNPFTNIVGGILGELPMVYCGLNAILHPARFSIASVAIYQTSTSHLTGSLLMLFRRNQHFLRDVSKVKQMYSTAEIQNKIVGGELAYPSSEKSDEGMSIELRNVCFSYPGSHKTSGALTDISLSIPGGSLVVIVGANGSGKSTLIRLLARLFDPSSGDILIDGRPGKDYNMADLRRATTILSQDNKIYPLSFAENIGLGLIQSSDDMELIKKAAEQGGAAEFIGKLDTGYETRSGNWSHTTLVLNMYGKSDHPLNKEMDKLEKETKISGGEQQRLAASRSFMRFNSGKVKFVAVDEPSSALDAEGELQLFNRLREVRQGKTMIFVTHRFGHLTKHADMIVCMKDSKIVEQGRHEDLLQRGGEYAKLYNIQANAFLKDGSDAQAI